MISQRTVLSFCQYLDLQGTTDIRILFEKHGLQFQAGSGAHIQRIQLSLSTGTPQQIESILEEIVRTEGYFADKVCGWPFEQVAAYKQRWQDLILCLELDGYRVFDQKLIPIDPTIEGASPVEDDLTREIERLGLPEGQGVLQSIRNASEAFRRVPPDYNACLGNARVALQTLARAIATARRTIHPHTFDETVWGQVMDYLRVSGLITKQEEECVTSVYSLISTGAHSPIETNQAEMARLGLSLAVSMCYFLVKRYNQP